MHPLGVSIKICAQIQKNKRGLKALSCFFAPEGIKRNGLPRTCGPRDDRRKTGATPIGVALFSLSVTAIAVPALPWGEIDLPRWGRCHRLAVTERGNGLPRPCGPCNDRRKTGATPFGVALFRVAGFCGRPMTAPTGIGSLVGGWNA